MFLNLFRNKHEIAYKTYDKHAVVFQEISKRLLERLAIIKIQPQTTLDLIMGVSYTSLALSKQYPDAQMIVASDDQFALNYLQKKQRLRFNKIQPIVCTTFAEVALPDGSVDLIVANLLLPWCENLVGLFTEVKRLLKPGGLFIFSSLGPDTLKELTRYLQQPFEVSIKDTLLDMHLIGDELMQVGFSEPVMEMEMLQVNYTNLDKLLEELTVLKLLSSADFRPITPLANELNTSLEVIYGHAWQPKQRVKSDTGEVYISIDQIIKRG
ncbi:MAG: biotin biosynthesis protein BioC [Gammaproteobacteria bacterium]|jgi:malonyl-CoA O-methyltransferase|nr:biotin biosynthesis protein BioC [Gammaproteobacteria bacterium]